jgi:hypothetical protein
MAAVRVRRRWGVTAADLIEYLPEAFCEHEDAMSE